MSHSKSTATVNDAVIALDAIPPDQIPAAIAHLAARILTSVSTTEVKTSATSAEVSDDLLTPAQAAALLHVSRKYIYDHVRELGGVRIGRGPRARLRFARSKVLARIGR